MTQCEQVLNYMRTHGNITARDAVNYLDIYRLSARIADLKADGYLIKSESVRKKNGKGEWKHYASYSLVEGDE